MDQVSKYYVCKLVLIEFAPSNGSKYFSQLQMYIFCYFDFCHNRRIVFCSPCDVRFFNCICISRKEIQAANQDKGNQLGWGYKITNFREFWIFIFLVFEVQLDFQFGKTKKVLAFFKLMMYQVPIMCVIKE